MSGRRAKALRKAFYQIHHRSPETTETKQLGIFRYVRMKLTKKEAEDPKSQKFIPINKMLVTEAYNEWRRFKRVWTARSSRW